MNTGNTPDSTLEPTRTELVEKAGAELADLVVLALDDISNRKQIGEFTTEGFEAVRALADGMHGLSKEDRAAAASHLMNALHARVNAELLPLD